MGKDTEKQAILLGSDTVAEFPENEGYWHSDFP
jgi:hypothetical protein